MSNIFTYLFNLCTIIVLYRFTFHGTWMINDDESIGVAYSWIFLISKTFIPARRKVAIIVGMTMSRVNKRYQWRNRVCNTNAEINKELIHLQSSSKPVHRHWIWYLLLLLIIVLFSFQIFISEFFLSLFLWFLSRFLFFPFPASFFKKIHYYLETGQHAIVFHRQVNYLSRESYSEIEKYIIYQSQNGSTEVW